MYPDNSFNQVLQQALKQETLKQVVIEIQETWGDHKNRGMSLFKEDIISMEYIDGVLVISCGHTTHGTFTEFIKWEDVRSIQFNPVVRPNFNSLPNLSSL